MSTRTFRSMPLLLLVLLLGMQMFTAVCGARCASSGMTAVAGAANADSVRCDACPHMAGAHATSAMAAGLMQVCSQHEESFAAAAEQRLAAPVIAEINLQPVTTVNQILPRLQLSHTVQASISPGSRFPSLLNIRV